MLADRVALLDGGVVVATGTHQDLLATQDRYRELMSGEREPGEGRGPGEGKNLTEAWR
jgi:ABC-type transport system involved in cytochrome bd biosynthesis fused ATPase/permease subunit